MKKILAMAATLLMLMIVLPLAVGAASSKADLPFSDVKSDDWYYDSVMQMYESNLMKGVSKTEFAPGETLTRGMCAAILYRAAGEPDVEGKSSFADVDAGAYYAKAVAWAQQHGVVNGKTKTDFVPNGKITRAEFATMLFRSLGVLDYVLPAERTGQPADTKDIAQYARDAVVTLYRSGIVEGRTNGRFDPDATITRAETCALVSRFLDSAIVDASAQSDLTVVDDTPVETEIPDEDEIPEYDPELDITLPGTPDQMERQLERVNVRWEQFYNSYFKVWDTRAWVTFIQGDDGGFYKDVDIADLEVGYIPEGLVERGNAEVNYWEELGYHTRLFVFCDPNDETAPGCVHPPFVMIHVEEGNEPSSFSDEAFAMSEEITINGMGALMLDTFTSYEGKSLEITRLQFGDGNLNVYIQGSGVSAADVIKVAESILPAAVGSEPKAIPNRSAKFADAAGEADDVITIGFFSDGVTANSGIAEQFAAIAEGRNVEIVDLSFGDANGMALVDRWLNTGDYAAYKDVIDSLDVIVVTTYNVPTNYGRYLRGEEVYQPVGGFPTINEGDDVESIVAGIGSEPYDPNLPKLRELFGADKEYYYFANYDGLNFKKESYDEMAAILAQVKDAFMTEWGFNFVTSVGDAHMCMGDADHSHYYANDNFTCPNALAGYCSALYLYCEMFSEAATAQNDGALTADAIPGDTAEEDAAFIATLKDSIQSVIDDPANAMRTSRTWTLMNFARQVFENEISYDDLPGETLEEKEAYMAKLREIVQDILDKEGLTYP